MGVYVENLYHKCVKTIITQDDLKHRVLNEIDPDLLVELLEISTEELVDFFEERLVSRAYKFIDDDEEFIPNGS